MPRYLIQAPHSAEECPVVLTELLGQGAAALIQFDFTCGISEAKDHLAVAVLEVASEAAARETVPTSIRERASITEVRKVVPEEVRLLRKAK